MNGVITDGNPQITGSFTQESSKALADQLKFGALPLSFTVQSSDTISATLGTLAAAVGLIAGLIGLILVVIYSLFQYRALGFGHHRVARDRRRHHLPDDHASCRGARATACRSPASRA